MEVKKAIKKVAAIGTGAAFLATTLSGAMAASLADYPAPFVSNGQFDAIIVVGQNAKADDVIGAVDIGTGLQFAMKKEKTVSTGAPTATATAGIQIQKTGNHVNLGRSLADVQDTSLSDSDLPDLLADGLFRDNEGDNFNEETYTQKLFILNASGDASKGNFYHDQPSSPVDRDANTYVFFDNVNSRPIYRFQFEFDTKIDYNNATSATVKDDIEDNVLEIQGHDFTITKVQTTTSNKMDELTLFSGDTIVWLTQNQKISKTFDGVDHEVEVYDVTESADSCGVIVDGSLVWVDVDTTEIINGIEIGVTDAKVVHAQLQDVDVCQVNIGASKIELEHNNEVKKNGKDLDGSNVNILHEQNNAGKWTGFNITYSPKKDVYLAPGEQWTDPVFDGFKIHYAGNTVVTENISIRTSGSEKLELKYRNNDNKEVVVPFTTTRNSWVDTNGILPGEDWDELMLWENGQFLNDPNGIEGTQLFVVTAGKEVHILEIVDVDTTDNETDIEDVTYGRTYSDRDITFGANNGLDLSGIGVVTLNFTNDAKNLTATNIRLGSYPATVYDANLTFDTDNQVNTFSIDTTNQRVVQLLNITGNSSGTTTAGIEAVNITIDLVEKDEPASEDTASSIRVKTQLDTSSDEVEIGTPTNNSAQDSRHTISFKDITPDNSDTQVAMTFHGTKITYDTEDKKWVTYEYPEDQLFANIFITPISAEISQSSGQIQTVDLAKINVRAARFDTEVIDNVKGDNLIVVGGPCVNQVAAQLQGVTSAADCAAGYTDGEAIIKLYDTGAGKVALLVAGYKGLDTTAASRVLGNYPTYASQLKGSEVKVTYTSLSQITVGSPS